jgi:hypothetical protein
MASKLPIGQWKYVTTAGRAALIKFVIASQAILFSHRLASSQGHFEGYFQA